MATRDLFSEIKELRQRNPRRKGPFGDVIRRIDALTEETRKLTKRKRLIRRDREFLRHVPVAAIACVEGYYKGLICDLINVGPPFLQNAVNFREVRLTLEGLVGTHTRQVSVGELVTHTLRINNIEDLNRHMTAVLGEDFLKLMKSVENIPQKYLSTLRKTFDARHILAHEIAPTYSVPAEDAFDYLLSVFAIIFATEHYLQHTLFPGLRNDA